VTRRVKTKCGFSQHIKQDTHHINSQYPGGATGQINSLYDHQFSSNEYLSQHVTIDAYTLP